MASSASPDRGNGNDLICHRLNSLDERVGRLEESVSGLGITAARLDTKMNIVLGILGAIGSGATFLLIRLLAS